MLTTTSMVNTDNEKLSYTDKNNTTIMNHNDYKDNRNNDNNKDKDFGDQNSGKKILIKIHHENSQKHLYVFLIILMISFYMF